MTRTGLGLAVLLASGVFVGCGADTSVTDESRDCAFLMSEARNYISGLESYEDLETPMPGGADWVISELKSECPSEFALVRGEAEKRTQDLAGQPNQQDSPEAADSSRDEGTTPWDEAKGHLGDRLTVCGPLVNDGQSEDDVFLNLGRGYPDPDRFTVVIWDVGGVEEISVGTTVCATGTITLYKGVPQIEAPLSAVTADFD